MVLGLSYGEVAFIVAAGAAAFGPKDIPVAARTAGRLVGRAAGFLLSARNTFGSFAERTQINELHAELQQTMAQLEAIRYEIRSGVSLTSPGPLTRKIFQQATISGQQAAGAEVLSGSHREPATPPMASSSGTFEATSSAATTTGMASAAPAATTTDENAQSLVETYSAVSLERRVESRVIEALNAALPSRASRAAAPELSSRDQQWLRVHPGRARTGEEPGHGLNMPGPYGRESAECAMPQQLPAGRRRSMGGRDAEASESGEIYAESISQRQIGPSGERDAMNGSSSIKVLPISAVSAGLVPHRKDGTEGGADILSDAILEEQVARQALDYFQNSPSST